MDDDLRRSAQEPLCRICCTDGATSHPEPRSPSWAILGPLHSPYAQHGWYPRRSLGQGGETNRFKGCYTGVTGWGGCGSHPYFPPPGGGEIRVFMGLVWDLHSSTLLLLLHLPHIPTGADEVGGRATLAAISAYVCDVAVGAYVCGGVGGSSLATRAGWLARGDPHMQVARALLSVRARRAEDGVGAHPNLHRVQHFCM